ncbi:hypothetical protein [Neisseria musculi]|uniref:hypothetical protein n=1 Tax=Neisseria musculi TaxID=1815583 RepID=UPI00336C1B10
MAKQETGLETGSGQAARGSVAVRAGKPGRAARRRGNDAVVLSAVTRFKAV